MHGPKKKLKYSASWLLLLCSAKKQKKTDYIHIHKMTT